MVPNLANIAKNSCFPKKLPTFLGNIFYAKFASFFEILIASIGKTIQFGLFIKLMAKL